MEDRAETPGKHPCPPPASAPQSRSQKPARASSVDRGLALQAPTQQWNPAPAHPRAVQQTPVNTHASAPGHQIAFAP